MTYFRSCLQKNLEEFENADILFNYDLIPAKPSSHSPIQCNQPRQSNHEAADENDTNNSVTSSFSPQYRPASPQSLFFIL